MAGHNSEATHDIVGAKRLDLCLRRLARPSKNCLGANNKEPYNKHFLTS